MRNALLTAIAVVVLSASSALASEQTDVLQPVHQFIAAMNGNDAKAGAAAYAPQATILDEFPPYHWSGAAAYSDWGRDFEAFAKKNDMTEPKVTLGKPHHVDVSVDVSGDRAYAVIPATFSFKQHG